MNDAIPYEISDYAQTAHTVLTEMIGHMDFPGTVEVTESADHILLTLTSPQPLGMLIGRGGQTLNAIEVVVTAITQHKTGIHGKRILVDAEGYRQRQTERLAEMAEQAAAQVMETGEPVAMTPMNARDRRLVHTTISEMSGVATYSSGEEPYRFVVVCLPEQVPEEEEE